MSPQALLFLLAAAAVLLRILFSAAEVAYARVPRRRARERYGQVRRGVIRVLFALMQEPEGAFAAARAGAMTSLALAAGLGGGALLLAWPAAWPIPSGNWVALPFASGALGAALLCLLLELIPRALAAAAPDRWALRLAPLLGAAFLFSAGPATLLRRMADRILAPFGARATFRAPDPALEEIERILSEAGASDEEAPSPQLVQSLFELPSMVVREVMIPRTEVVAINLHASSEEVVRKVVEHRHTCFPVFDDEIDRVVGVLHTKDALPFLARPADLDLLSLLRPAVFVPWGTRLGKLLLRMQRESLAAVMIADEHGGFLGIATWKDVLAEAMGGLAAREPAEAVAELDDGSHLVEAGLPIDAFNQHFQSELPENGSFGTLAGFLNQLAGSIPEVGQVLESNGLRFTVVERTPRRVVRVRISKPLPEESIGAA